jgi:hypothetical protein
MKNTPLSDEAMSKRLLYSIVLSRFLEKGIYLSVGYSFSNLFLSDEEALICGVLLKITHIFLWSGLFRYNYWVKRLISYCGHRKR